MIVVRMCDGVSVYRMKSVNDTQSVRSTHCTQDKKWSIKASREVEQMNAQYCSKRGTKEGKQKKCRTKLTL